MLKILSFHKTNIKSKHIENKLYTEQSFVKFTIKNLLTQKLL